MSATATQQRIGAHELLQLQELIRMESMGVQQVQAMLPMISDPEFKQLMTTCVETGKAHVNALVDFCKLHNLA